jgi:glycosyltransferase involved in cell wall biosynthesis
MAKKKIAIFTSHPIEQQGPFFKVLAAEKDIDLTVFFAWDFGVQKPGFDADMKANIKWDIPLLDGYKHKFLKNLSLRPGSSRFWGEFNPGIIAEVWNGKYDAFIVYGWNCAGHWLAFLGAIISGTPLYIRAESPLNQELSKPSWLIGIKKLILGTLFHLAKGILYIGEENRKFYLYYGVKEEKMFFAPYAVDNERFFKEAERLVQNKANLKLAEGIHKDTVVILFLGKLIQKKRPLDLLQAYSRIKNANKALIFVGNGTLREELEDLKEKQNLENVFFVGFKNQTEISKYYALGDIFVLPSGEGETWGLVINEAMCFSLPIVAGNMVGSSPDLVRQNGIVFQTGNVDELEIALGKFIENHAMRIAAGKHSKEIVENYSYHKDIKGFRSALGLH